MENEWNKVLSPALNLGKPIKEENRLLRWLARHPRFILPFIVGCWVSMFGSMTILVLFVN